MVPVRVTAVACALAALTAACGGGSASDPVESGLIRAVPVRALDELRFDPPSISVREGETVRFEIENVGKTEHEFVLGDEQTHANHVPGGHQHGGALAAVTLAPGAKEIATVTFSRSGTLTYACHVNDHDDAGMVGTLTVAD